VRFRYARSVRHPFYVTVGAWLALVLQAQAQLSGDVQLNFTAQQLPLWDLSGTYTRSNATATSTNFAEQTLNHGPDGKVTGTGSATVQDESSDIHGSEILAGRVTGGAGKPVVLNANGEGTFGGKARGINVSGKLAGNLSLVVDSTNRVMSGRETVSFCLGGGACRTVSTNSSFPLQPNMDGSWSLALAVGTTNDVVAGTAVATLSNGRTVPFSVRGKYSPATQRSNLRLTSDSAALKLTITDAAQLDSLRGKLFGQKLKL
jgi:hypothetical protein